MYVYAIDPVNQFDLEGMFVGPMILPFSQYSQEVKDDGGGTARHNYFDPGRPVSPALLPLSLIFCGPVCAGAGGMAMVTEKSLSMMKGLRVNLRIDGPSHYFKNIFNPKDKLWMRHIQADIYISGIKGWVKSIRIPFGPAYKLKHGKGGIRWW